MQVRFLNRDEIAKTKALAAECFGCSDDLDTYYDRDVQNNRIAVLEEQGTFLSMAHLHRLFAVYDKKTVPVWYILYVCTARAHRRRGYMERVMQFVLQTLKEEGEAFTFLVPVNAAVYASLGFTHSWRFREAERNMLYADDGLTTCYACSLCDGAFVPPEKLQESDTPAALCFKPFDDEAAARYFDYFSVRPNKSCDSVPLDCFIWSSVIKTEYCLADGRCFMMRDLSDDRFAGCIPFCKKEELPYYFKLQERYFNRVLHIPFRAFLQDCEGVELLRAAGALEHYEVTEEAEIFDYLYSGNDLRTLAGRGFSKKRNRIHKFESTYGGRWEYRTLGYEDRAEITAFLKKWDEDKTVMGAGVNLGREYDVSETLQIEALGTQMLLNSRPITAKIKIGGIYIDGRLCAFSVGSYNAREKMAVIEIEKADPTMDGLYQLINREFLVHEFPEAELVNREDDLGIPGLRQAKMSYNPVLLEKRYTILQKDFKPEWE